MSFTLRRATVSLNLLPLDSHPPFVHPDYNPDTHRLFSAYVMGALLRRRYSALVCIPNALLGPGIPLDQPVRTVGSVVLHLVDGVLAFQIDVDSISSGALPVLIGVLLMEFHSESGHVLSPADRDAWVVDQLYPTRRQFW